MKKEKAQEYLETKASVEFLGVLNNLSDMMQEMMPELSFEDVFDIVLAYFDRSRNAEIVTLADLQQIINGLPDEFVQMNELLNLYREKRQVDGMNGRTWNAPEHLRLDELIEEKEKWASAASAPPN